MKKTIVLLSVFLLVSVKNTLTNINNELEEIIAQEEKLELQSEPNDAINSDNSENLETLIEEQIKPNIENDKDTFLEKIEEIEQEKISLNQALPDSETNTINYEQEETPKEHKDPGKVTSFLIGLGIGITGTIGFLFFS